MSSKLMIGGFTLGICQTNSYFIHREGDTRCVFIDPADRGAELYKELEKRGLTVEAILITHGHFDHILGVAEMKELSGAKVYAPETEKTVLSDVRVNLSSTMGGKPVTLEADVYVKEGDVLTFGDMSCKVLLTPGHTIGGCSFYFEKDKVLFSGDTLFYESIGRTDFPGGDMNTLLASVEEKIFTLPEEVKIYPGHGPDTTVEHEKRYNPFF